MIKIASQFSGIGSFEQAITNLGIEHENIMAVDFDKYARQTYTANFGEPKHYFVDSYNADYENVENVDVFLSSPPCQSFSLAGKRLGESDPRGLLFFETLRFINCNKPKYFIIENVKGILSDNSGKTFQSWIHLLGQSVNGNPFFFPHEDSLMYNLHWQVLNTKDYGLPQNRERVFLVGIRNDLPNTFVFPKGVPLKLRFKDILEHEVDEKYYLSEKMINGFISHTEKHKARGNGFEFKPTDGNCISKAITTRAGTRVDDNYLKIPSATKSGYEIATEGDSINLEHPNSETRRGTVGKQVAQTLTTSCNQGIMVVGNYHKSGHEASRIVNEEGIYPTVKENHGTTPAVMIGAMRGRNPDNPNDRSKGGNYKQTLEINENGTSNCLSTVQKDNLVVESVPIFEIADYISDEGLRIRKDGISPCLNSSMKDGEWKANIGTRNPPITSNGFRIRKLTPLECFRLQGFDDSFVKPVSNSQLYKQAGNTISVNVIQAILKNLLKDA